MRGPHLDGGRPDGGVERGRARDGRREEEVHPADRVAHLVKGSGFGVWGLGLRVEGLGL